MARRPTKVGADIMEDPVRRSCRRYFASIGGSSLQGHTLVWRHPTNAVASSMTARTERNHMLMALGPSPTSVAVPDSAQGANLRVSRGKLAPPLLAFDAVLTHAAEVLLRGAVLARLVTVCAPPGYGKTVVLRRLYQALSHREQRCLWITLDDRDVSVNSILDLCQAAVADNDPANRETHHPQTVGEDPRRAIERLLHLLESLAGPTILFIDNLSFCTDPLLEPLLERLVFTGPPKLRLVLSGVGRLPIDATRARLELSAVELQASQLAFDRETITRFLQLAKVPQDAATVARVHQLTEGWPAAVRLLQILIVEAGDAAGVLARFSGTDRDVADVLTRRVLAEFDVERVTFLVEIAPLREFSAELAEHVTGRTEASAWINDLLDRNLLVFPLDRSRSWTRMHTLLRQYLLAEGQRRLPRERRREILERAAYWHADHGDDVAALEAALEAPSPVLAARMLDRVARPIAGGQGRLSLYVGWVEQLLACGITLSLEAHTWYVWSLCFTLQYERAHRAMDALDHRLAEADPQGHIRGLHARVGLLRAVVATNLDLMDTARTEAQCWLRDSAKRDPLGVATVAAAAATAELALGDIDAARRYVQQARAAVARSSGSSRSFAHAWVLIMSACIELTDGEPALADHMLSEARSAAVDSLGEDASVVATIDFVHARALLELGRTESARLKATAGLARAAAHGLTETTIQGLAACVALWDGSESSPFDMEALDAVARSYPPRAQRALCVLQVQRLLDLGRVSDAQTLARRQLLQLPLHAQGASSVLERLIGLRLQATTGDSRQVQDELDRLLRLPTTGPREIVALHLLAAELHMQSDQQRLALRSFSLAVSKAARRRLLQPFLERPAMVSRILAGVPDKSLGFTQGDEVGLLAELRARTACAPAGEGATPISASASGVPLEALTPRELQMLELLALGLSNQQIADRLALTVPTIKWHFSNLYGKLLVKSRSAALARARALQLLRS